ncbi:hypothetical protein CV102_00525 [Natronococcus pandeyae]|uniref:Uncharacterized protein n=1 Tax=Natronococcus pandeyae TaxID=2055836 RepID=A0A8J8TRL0_9EURY|nr:hypothetical protein [Natronococcus pandeyae]TYL40101.1 hypothetical protein CV102_00525 [Natronococcus pandeyae]
MADDQPDYLEDPPEIDWPKEEETPTNDDLGPASEDDLELVGMASTAVLVHSAESSMLYHGEVNEDGRVTPRFDDEVDADTGDDGSLSDAISDLGDRLGWDSLTDYGREHWSGQEPPEE